VNIVNQTKTIGIHAPLEVHKQIVGIEQANVDLNTSVSEISLVVMEQFLLNWTPQKNEVLRRLLIERRKRSESYGEGS
jgi:hypothetical protein